ncbi:MAG TPA: hypothetical protein PK801_04305 [Aggregatilineales bacterium]|nr:hypothetical protein [Aggregatilineales bacterium]
MQDKELGGSPVVDRQRALVRAIERWRDARIEEYWLGVSYMGPAVNRFGDHDLTVVKGELWHRWDGRWRKIARGSDYWLFSVPGAFAWARDVLRRMQGGEQPQPTLELEFDETLGYVKRMRLTAAGRDASNFTFEVRRFGRGPHPAFTGQGVGG